MPTVKGYGAPTQEVAPIQGGRSSVSVNPNAGFGPKLSQIGMDIFAEEQHKQDQVAALEVDRKLSEWENSRLYDPKQGALGVKGKDAFGLPDTVNKEFDAYAEQVRTGLNDRQQLMAERLIGARRKDINSTLTRHVFQEVQKFDESETTNYLKNSQQAAALNYNDVDRIALEVDRQSAAITDFAKRRGISNSETEKQMRTQAISNTHVGVLDRFLANGQDLAAKQYYDAIKPALAGDDIIKVEQKLKVATTEGEGMRAADEVWKVLGPAGDQSPVQTDKMLDMLKTKLGNNPLVLKAAQTALHERANMHNTAQRERRESASSVVWTAIEQGAGVEQIRRMPEYLALPGHEQVTIKEHMVDRANRRGREESDMQTYYSLVNMASSQASRKEFSEVNLYEKFKAKLSDADFKHFAAMQAAVRNGDDKATDKLLASDKLQNQMVTDALLSMKLDPTPNEKTSKGDLEKILGFRRTVRESVRAHEIATGKNATDADVQGIVDNLLTRGNVAGTGVAGYFQTERRVFDLKPGESLVVKRKDIPGDEVRKIEQALTRAGRRVTDEAVTTMYQAKLLRMRGEAPARPDPRKAVPD